jgi:hypothetical protein
MLSLDDILAPVPGVLFRQSGEELVVVLPSEGRFFVLNRTGAQVFQMIDGRRTLGEIAEAMSQEYQISPERAGQDVLALAGKLLERGVVIKKQREEQ